jgi:hypothetical protein
MKHQSKFKPGQQQEQAAGQEHTQQQAGREFAGAEELLRYDAGQTQVPSSLERRLRKSSAGLPAPTRPWWKRLFGGTNP